MLQHLPVTSKASWSFYAALLVTQAAPSWQPLNVVWLSFNFKTPQKRAIAYAVYSKCLFTPSDTSILTTGSGLLQSRRYIRQSSLSWCKSCRKHYKYVLTFHRAMHRYTAMHGQHVCLWELCGLQLCLHRLWRFSWRTSASRSA